MKSATAGTDRAHSCVYSSSFCLSVRLFCTFPFSKAPPALLFVSPPYASLFKFQILSLPSALLSPHPPSPALAVHSLCILQSWSWALHCDPWNMWPAGLEPLHDLFWLLIPRLPLWICFPVWTAFLVFDPCPCIKRNSDVHCKPFYFLLSFDAWKSILCCCRNIFWMEFI